MGPALPKELQVGVVKERSKCFFNHISLTRHQSWTSRHQNTDGGLSGIIIHLKLVKTSSEEDLHSPEEHDRLLHGTKVLFNLLQPWLNKQHLAISSDRYFASVQACDELKKRRLRFICVVVASTRGFCVAKLSEIEIERRGMWEGYFALGNEKKLEKFALVWVDRYQRYFISNTSFLKPGMSYARDRLRQVDDSTNVDPVCVEFEINQSRVYDRYYSRNSNNNERNRTRRDCFQLERKLQIKDWSIRVNISILLINGVDAYYLGKACKCWNDRNPAEFHYNLSEDMIDNRFNERRTQRNQSVQPI